MLEDVTPKMSTVTSTPQEAADNIEGAKVFNISPDVYKDHSEFLKTDVMKMKFPTEVDSSVSEHMKDPETTALLSHPGDAHKLGFLGTQWQLFKDMFEDRDSQKKINALALEKMDNPKDFSEDKQIQLDFLNSEVEDRGRQKELANPNGPSQVAKFMASGGDRPDWTHGGDLASGADTPSLGEAVAHDMFSGQFEQLPSSMTSFALDAMDTVDKHKGLIASAAVLGGLTTAEANIVPIASAYGAGPIIGTMALAGSAAPGAMAGASMAFSTAMIADMWENQTASFYNQFSNLKKDDGTPANMDETTKRNLSMGASAVSNAIAVYAGVGVAKTIPFFAQWMGKTAAKELVTDPTGEAIRQTVNSIGNSMAHGAIGMTAAEVTNVIAEEMAKSNAKASRAGYLNALWAAKDRIVSAALTGGAISGTTTTIGAGLGYRGVKRGFQIEKAVGELKAMLPEPTNIVHDGQHYSVEDGTINNPPPTLIGTAVKSLQLDALIDHTNKTVEGTEVGKLAPDKASEIQKSFLDRIGLHSFFVNPEGWNKWVSKESNAKIARGLIDPSESWKNSINAPVAIENDKFMEAVKHDPTFSGEAKISPEAMSGAEAEKFINEHKAAEQKRQELKVKLAAKEIKPEEKIAIEKELAELPEMPKSDIPGVDAYLDQTRLKAAIKDMMPEGQQEKFLEADLKAKQANVDAIEADRHLEMEQVKDFHKEMADDVQREMQAEKLADDKNLKIVDEFTKEYLPPGPKGGENSWDPRHNHSKEGYSPWAIDPKSLPEELAHYKGNAQLKEHKAFIKGGMPLDEAARMVGVKSGEELLKLLASTPSRAVAIERGVENNSTKNAQRVEKADIEFNDTATANAFRDKLSLAMEVLKHMKNREWTDMKGAIKRIAKKPPSVLEITAKAKETVDATKTSRLKPNQYRMGERVSETKKMDALLKGEHEVAFEEQIALAHNIALTKETQKALLKYNRRVDFMKRFNKPETIAILKEAGVYDAAKAVLDLFNFNPKDKSIPDKESFAKYVKKTTEAGGVVSVIPDHLFDVRKPVKDMTYKEFMTVTDVLKNMLHEAKWKNELFRKHEGLAEARNISLVADKLVAQAESLPEFDASRSDVKQTNTDSKFKTFGKHLRNSFSLVDRVQHLIARMDTIRHDVKNTSFAKFVNDAGIKAQGVVGDFNEYIWRPIADAAHKKKEMAIELKKHMEGLIENFNKKGEKEGPMKGVTDAMGASHNDYEKMAYTFHKIPEFDGFSALQDNGKTTTLELFMMELNFGNEGNLEGLERFKNAKGETLSRDTIRMVLDRELQHRHTELAQDYRNIFERYKPQIKELQMRTEGTEPEWVSAKPYEARGRQYDGGYFPLFYLDDPRQSQGAKLVGKIEQNRQAMYAQAVTEQGHLESRVGFNGQLELKLDRYMHSLDQVLHDLTHREAVRDVGKILNDERISKAIVGALGQTGYETISDMVISVSDPANSSFNKTAAHIGKFIKYFGEGIATVRIAWKTSSMMIQPASLAFAVDKMGIANGGKHMTSTLQTLLSHPELYEHFLDFAAEIHPAIRDVREDLEGDTVHAFLEMSPKYMSKAGRVVKPLAVGRDFIKEQAFQVLGEIDQLNKVVVALSGYSQAINGDVHGIDVGDHAAAVKYASNLNELTQTHSNARNLSPLQREKLAKPMIMFWNDANNVLNSTITRAQQAKENFKQTGNAIKEGEYKDAMKFAGAGTVGIMRYMVMIAGAAGYYENHIRHMDSQNLSDDDTSGPLSFAWGMTKIGFDNIMGTFPYLRDVFYAANNKLWEKNPQAENPYGQVGNDMAGAFRGLEKYLGFMEGEPTKQDAKAMMNTIGVLGRIPVDAIYKGLDKPDLTELPILIKSEAKSLSNTIGKWLTKDENVKAAPPEFVEELKKIQHQIDPEKAKEEEARQIMEDFKKSETPAPVDKPSN